LKVGHYQCECRPGDYPANIAKVLRGLEFAQRERLDIMCFPESFLTGYFDTLEKFQRHSWPLDGAEVRGFLKRVAKFPTMFMVGLNERRRQKIHNTVILVERGKIRGAYRKVFPCSEHETPGRKFPVFEKNAVKFGIVICADGGYIEPARILALKGARIIFAPHYNYIPPQGLIGHFMKVRADHTARAVENGVWFMRCNNVCPGKDPGLNYEGVGYGDSYLMDPAGEIVVRSERHKECFMTATVRFCNETDYQRRSRESAANLLPHLQAALKTALRTAAGPARKVST
jgi:predicted amidohydrolase